MFQEQFLDHFPTYLEMAPQETYAVAHKHPAFQMIPRLYLFAAFLLEWSNKEAYI